MASRRAKGPRLRSGGNRVRGADFFGREREVERFWSILLDEEEHLLVLSPRRLGKSSLLQHALDHPREGWTPVFVDFQGRKDGVAGLIAIVDALEGAREVGKSALGRLAKALGQVEEVGLMTLSLKMREAARTDWDGATSALEKALRGAVKERGKLLMLTDELPQLVSRTLSSKDDAVREEAKLLLEFLRKIRQDGEMRDGFRMVIAGSIGLRSVLRRHNRTRDANDLADLRLGPWSRDTALRFMAAISATDNLDLDQVTREAVLECVGETPVPFHVQKLLAAVRDAIADPNVAETSATPELVRRLAEERIGVFELGHFSERLNEGVPEDEAAFASAALDRIAQEGPQPRDAVEALARDPEVVTTVMTMLLEEGYLRERSGRLGFATPLLERYWRAYEMAPASRTRPSA